MTPLTEVSLKVNPHLAAPGQVLGVVIDARPCIVFHSDAELAVWLDGCRDHGALDEEPKP